MNRFINICILCLCQLAFIAQAGWATTGNTMGIDTKDAEEVNIYEYSTTCMPDYNYSPGSEHGITIDWEAIAADLNVETDNLKIFAVLSDGTLDDNYEVGNTDGWRDATGNWAEWNSDDNLFCVQFSGLDLASVGCMRTAAPITYTATFKVVNADDSEGNWVTLKVSLIVKEQNKYVLTLKSIPESIGSFNYRYGPNEVSATAPIDIWTYLIEDFEFVHWLGSDGNVYTKENSFSFTMPESDVEFTAVYKYNPESPDDPQPMDPQKIHTLFLEAIPAAAASFNMNSATRVEEGEKYVIEAYPREDYQFREWRLKGEVVSTDSRFSLTMPNEDVKLVAVYEYNPENPGNPNTNAWNPETGEVIMDDFQPGNLSGRLSSKVGGQRENVTMITVMGPVNESDWGVANEYSNCTFFDMSRTTGMDYVPSWLFDHNQVISTIVLPASIETIGDYAFNQCENLHEIHCFASIPPTVSSSTFNGVDGLIVFVPVSALPLYQEAEIWKDFTILPFSNEVCTLEVNFSENTDMDLYKDMNIELVNTKSGQRQRYLVTNARRTYTFSSLIKKTTYNVYLKNAQGLTLGEISNVPVTENDKELSCTFENLMVPRDLTVTVMTPEGNDVTDQTSIVWMTEKDEYLSQGPTLTRQLEGTKVKYRVGLSQDLAMKYLLPEDTEYEVSDENDITYDLEAIPQISIEGLVVDLKNDNQPLEGATVFVSQMLNGQYSWTTSTKTDENGVWTMTVYDTPIDITASKSNYLSVSQSLQKLTPTIPVFGLKDVNGTKITLAVTYTNTVGETMNSYDDQTNVVYAVNDDVTGKEITEFNLQYPQIVLLDSHEVGTVLRITATSLNGKFMPVTAKAVVNEIDCATAELPIIQLGGIKAVYGETGNSSVSGILYDENGKLVKKFDYAADATLTINELKDGNYTLVSMANSQFFNSIGSLDLFTESGLKERTDYLKNVVTVKSGKITNVRNAHIPDLDETKLYYTGENTSIAINKNQITVGNYLTITAHVDFKEAYVSGVSDVNLIIDLPEQSVFVQNSVMIGSQLADDYTYDEMNHRLTIQLSSFNDRIRFCFVPTVGGSFTPAATVRFKFGSKVMTQPIGNVEYTAKDYSIKVPSLTAKLTIPVTGTAFGRSKVEIYDNGVFAGQTTSLANGSWSTKITLTDDTNLLKHYLYAKITSQDGNVFQTSTDSLIYDKDAIEVETVEMINTAHNSWSLDLMDYHSLFDFQNPSPKTKTYWYWPLYPTFTFILNFTNNESVKDVVLHVKTSDGRIVKITAIYNEKKQCWIASNDFDSYQMPRNVSVTYIIIDKLIVGGNSTGYSGDGDAEDVQDPSGFVYEGVLSNRLQGVTATAYYKETVEDIYGDIHENIVLWNAEEYAQQNPLFTDENGEYAWDVPNGLWQVKFEKEGYQTTYSEWLPVPPPQLDVNIPMVQYVQPEVKSCLVMEDCVEIEFDKYMDPSSLTTENIKVMMNGENVNGTIKLVNEEAVSEEDDAQTYASKVRFLVEEGTKLTSENAISVTVSRAVTSYAGIPMQEDFTQEFAVEAVISKISVDELITVELDGTRTITIAALPADAAKGKKIGVKALSTMIASINASELILDDEGQAQLEITGELPGTTVLNVTVENSEVKGQASINVLEKAKMVTLPPTASRADGSDVYYGSIIKLASETKNAAIYYTLDGSEPDESAILYKDNEPIVITDAITIKAIAIGVGLEQSESREFSYKLKEATRNYNLMSGWNWISHNLESAVSVDVFKENAERILSQRDEQVKDPVVGWIGTLKELQPTEAYKVKVSTDSKPTLKGLEFNLTKNSIHVEAGWNWISYPVGQVMTLDEAFAFHEATEGDIIVGQDGFAEFSGGTWEGTLEGLIPGRGYQYKSAIADEIQFNTSISSSAVSHVNKRNYLIGVPWAPDKYAHPNVMPITAELFVDGVRVEENKFVVGAFVGSECRGIGIWKNGCLFMTVYGEGGEDIRFIAAENEGDNLYGITESISFKADNIGSRNAPYNLNLSSETSKIDALYVDLAFTPNVANDHLTVNLGDKEISRLTLTAMNGQHVVALRDVGKGVTITTNTLPTGVYILTVQAEGQTYYKKIMITHQ